MNSEALKTWMILIVLITPLLIGCKDTEAAGADTDSRAEQVKGCLLERTNSCCQAEQAAKLHNIGDIEQLRSAFNQAKDLPRLVLLLSPTCRVCVNGARWVQKEILAKYPDSSLRVYAIWLPMISDDSRSRWRQDLLTDSRVTHFWDEDRLVGRFFAKLSDPPPKGGVQWDAFFVYGPEASWDETPPPLRSFGRTVMGTREKLRAALAPLLKGKGEPSKDGDKAKCRAGEDKGKCCPAAAGAKCSAMKGAGCSTNADKGCSAMKGTNRPCPPAKQASCGRSPDLAKAAERLEKIGYSKEDIAALPASAILASAGSGYPVGFANLKAGQTVVDLGCGSGIDCLLAATLVGGSGKVIGVDKSPERIAAAKENKRKTRLENVEFREGLLEKLPLEDESIDVAISNCVPPVMRGKDVVLREAFRVLKPGGRLVTTSGLVNDDAPAEALSPEGDWGGRMGLPPLRQKDYFARLRAAGFAKVEVAAKSPANRPNWSKLMVVARKAGQVAKIEAKSRTAFSNGVTLPSSDIDREIGPCPVDGKAIKKHLSLDIVGLRLYACSEQCLETMRDPSFVRVELGKKQYVPQQVPVNRSRPRTTEQILKEMVFVEGGEYVRPGQYYLYREEKSRQGDRYTVGISSFYIDKCEVTVEEYCTFLNDGNEGYWNPWYPKIKRNESGRFVPAGPDVAKMPVGGVNYYQAKGYAQWAGKRLPTEAEWEYAAGGKEGRKYPWGNEEPDKTRTGFGGPIKPVGSFPKGATPEGVLDLLGNVTEWCADFYSEDYYRKAPPGNLLEDPHGPKSGYYRMTRGGCTGMKMVVTTRHQRPPLLSAGCLGFRCVRSAR